MKNIWIDENDFYDSHWDYRYGNDDGYINRKVERVIMPYDLEMAKQKWEQKKKAKRKAALV